MPKYPTENGIVFSKCTYFFVRKITRAWTNPGKVMCCCLVVLIWLYKLGKGGIVIPLNPEVNVNNIY